MAIIVNTGALDSDSITRGKFRRPRNRIDDPARVTPMHRVARRKEGADLNARRRQEFVSDRGERIYMELVTVISHVSSPVSFRHVSWNHEFDSRPSLPPPGCVSSAG